ncbi:MAG: tetratricopeptide repeat protein [Phycisphaerae bacterium]
MTTARGAILCAAVIAAAGSVGFGQYNRSAGGVQQVQPQGNALDASPQVGSGGSNTPITGYVPMNANNYTQGNTAGLGGRFNQQQSVVNINGVNVPVTNWNTGTQSPYQFRGDVGQNSSFNNWVRQSAGGLQTSPLSATDVYYLPSATVSTAQGSLYSSPYGSGFDSALIPRTAVNPGGTGMDTGLANGGVAIRQFSATPTNTQTLGNGPTLGSPLFAERAQNHALSVDLGANAVNQNNPAANPNPGGVNSPANGQYPGMNGLNNSNTGSGETDEDRRVREKLPKPADLSEVARVDARVSGQVSGRVEGQPDSVQNANVLPEGKMIAERSKVSDTYKTLMGEVEKAQEKARQQEELARANPQQAGKNAKSGEQSANAKGNTTGSAASASGTTNGGPGGTNGTGVASSIGAKGADGKPLPNPFVMAQSTDPTKPGYRSPELKSMRLEDMSTGQLQAGKNVPTVKTFGAGGRATPTPFDELMTKAEGLLKDGKYLDAANAYQTALISQPNNPLALLGRANAELGAGMYQSAAGDLKFVFTQHPELISVKYALQDYIPPQRQHQLLADLTELSQGKGVGNTAEFLLCYMDYNTGRDIELSRELGRWEARPWKDSWQGVMKRALGSGGE